PSPRRPVPRRGPGRRRARRCGVAPPGRRPGRGDAGRGRPRLLEHPRDRGAGGDGRPVVRTGDGAGARPHHLGAGLRRPHALPPGAGRHLRPLRRGRLVGGGRDGPGRPRRGRRHAGAGRGAGAGRRGGPRPRRRDPLRLPRDRDAARRPRRRRRAGGHAGRGALRPRPAADRVPRGRDARLRGL
ncbi:MAG: hypothetical protein AVDCRST_MAG59-4128, partial [uncultured Thermomicrobiales bacterium]